MYFSTPIPSGQYYLISDTNKRVRLAEAVLEVGARERSAMIGK
jgi:hypothetical protein